MWTRLHTLMLNAKNKEFVANSTTARRLDEQPGRDRSRVRGYGDV